MKKILSFALIALILLGSCLPVFAGGSLSTDLTTGFDIKTSAVLDDLSKTYIDGKKFDKAAYPLVAGAEYMLLLNVVEYGFEPQDKSAYGLYFYVYNPGGWKPRKPGAHAIQLSLRENSTYHKLDLALLDSTEDNRFLKFGLTYPIYGGKTLVSQLDAAKRSYFLSGIQIETVEKGKVEYKVAGNYTYTGYRSKNTLECQQDQISTISLDLHSTFYRTMTSSKGVGYQNQLDSVYFALDNSLIKHYGEVYAIHCSFTQKRVNAIVTSNRIAYDAVIGYLAAGKPIDQYPGYFQGYLPALKYGFVGEQVSVPLSIYNWGFNCNFNPQVLNNGKLPSMLFYVSEYDEDTRITSDDIEHFIKQYGLSNDSLLDLDGLKNDIGPFQDPYHYKIWKRDLTIPVDQSFELLSYTNNHGWLSTIRDYGLFHGNLGDDITIDQAIYPLDPVDFVGDDDFISSELYVDPSDIDEMKALVDSAEKKNQTVYLFRFNQQDYRSFPIYSVEHADLSWSVSSSEDGCYAEMDIYEDFDIMDISFRDQNGIVTILPVVSSPVDIYPDITPPPEIDSIFDDWANTWWDENQGWIRIVGIVAGVLAGCVLLYFVFRLIGSGRDALGKQSGSGSGGSSSRRRRKR